MPGSKSVGATVVLTDEVRYRLLRLLESNPKLTQRELDRERLDQGYQLQE
jgi:hypothetical protein